MHPVLCSYCSHPCSHRFQSEKECCQLPLVSIAAVPIVLHAKYHWLNYYVHMDHCADLYSDPITVASDEYKGTTQGPKMATTQEISHRRAKVLPGCIRRLASLILLATLDFASYFSRLFSRSKQFCGFPRPAQSLKVVLRSVDLPRVHPR